MFDIYTYLGEGTVHATDQGGHTSWYRWNDDHGRYEDFIPGRGGPPESYVTWSPETGPQNSDGTENTYSGGNPDLSGESGDYDLYEGGLYDDIDSALGQGGLGEDYNNDGVVNILDIIQKREAEEYTPFEFSSDDHGFAPSGEEFRTYIEQTGNLTGLLEGFGVGDEYAKFFDPPDLDKLDLYSDKYQLTVDRAETAYDIGTDKASADLKFAERSAEMGERSLFEQAGSQLISSKTQADTQVSKAGFATHGGITSTKGLADKGVISSFQGQQAGLQLGVDQAFSTYDFTTRGLEADRDFSRRGASLDHRSSVLDFWSGVEDDFYDTLGAVKGGTFG